MNTYPELDDLLDYSLARLWSELDEADDRMCILRMREDTGDLEEMVALMAEARDLDRYVDRLSRVLVMVTAGPL